MRRVRYEVAASLDGYIAGPQEEIDWIVNDPEIDLTQLFNQFDTLLIGRRTFEWMIKAGQTSVPGKRVLVFSRTLDASKHPGIEITATDAAERVAALRAEDGKDIWLFGGGELFRSLLRAGLVDTVEVAVIPVLLGGGVPLLPSPAEQTRLRLTDHRVYGTGIVALKYDVLQSS